MSKSLYLIVARTAAGAPLRIIVNASAPTGLRSIYLFNVLTPVGLPNSPIGMSLNIFFLKLSMRVSISLCCVPFKTSSTTCLKKLPNTLGKLDFLYSKPFTSNVSFGIPSCLVIHWAYRLVARK